MAVYERDPACHRLMQPLLFFKGYQAVQAYRLGHWLWTEGRRDLAYFVQMRVSEVFGVDIHPAARIGRGIMIDHAHSIVIGETAVVGDNVSMLHSVTLGGTGKEEEDRHPKIGNGVLIGAGAKVLGNIKVGNCSRIAAGSVVLPDVPPCKTVAGVPARIVGEAGCDAALGRDGPACCRRCRRVSGAPSAQRFEFPARGPSAPSRRVFQDQRLTVCAAGGRRSGQHRHRGFRGSRRSPRAVGAQAPRR